MIPTIPRTRKAVMRRPLRGYAIEPTISRTRNRLPVRICYLTNPITQCIKKNPLSIQQQGRMSVLSLLRPRKTHRPCVQLSGESAGLLEQAVGLVASAIQPPPQPAVMIGQNVASFGQSCNDARF